jgi:FlaA1/EpsC-like NDP-sugar epimerase
MVGADTFIVITSVYVVVALKHQSLFPVQEIIDLASVIIFLIIIVPTSSAVFGLYRQMVRFASPTILLEVFKGVTLAVITTKIFSLYFLEDILNYEFLVEIWAFLIIGTLSTRLIAKWIILNGGMRNNTKREPIAIFGAGEAGVSLLNSLDRNLDMEVVAIFDDNKKLEKRKIKNCTIFYADALEDTVNRLGIRQIIIAIPSISIRSRRDLFQRLENLGIRIRILPSVDEMIDGRVELSHIRDVKAADVLGREHHEPNEELLKRDVKGKSVMVTGGGGSIGSELCRQIVRNQAKRLVVFESSEYAIYEIEQELIALIANLGVETEVVTVLGDVRKQSHMEGIISKLEIETIYHAAAYKHVPMVEKNICEGVFNNVFGTLSVAQAALKQGVSKFVLVSTDKAVRPTNVMGASKRLAEQTLQALQDLEGQNPKTDFTMVRFGNVLDSAGSVVPLFRRQIRAGGPITLTHKEVTRYFMTIPEAAQLVLQAGAMANGGEVFLLDMGAPVRIYDLAERMVKLSGLTILDDNNPDGDIEITITGLRPGEKLYEELFITDDVKNTDHASIHQAAENFIPWEKLKSKLEEMEININNADQILVRELLEELVEGYTPKQNGHN